MEEIIDALRSLADDVENNRVQDTDAIDRVRVLGDRIDDLSSLARFDASVANTNISQVIQVLGAKHRVGRPTVEIPLEAIEGYLSHGLKVQEIADMYGVHRTTIHRKMQQNGLSVSDMYSEMSDTQLDALVLEIHRIHLCGYRMLRYHLQGRGHLVQIHRVRQSLKRVDPEGTEQRALANRTLHRRQYSVPGPNCMWHIDGNHKLIRWRFVIHGGIDGFSRLVVFLSAATNNRATTVLDAFLGAVRQYGVPSRVRSDKGRENFEVAYYMVDNCGPNRNSHITGRSVHNQRIERLWRDVYTQVLDLFHTLFHEMEASWMLNPDSESEDPPLRSPLGFPVIGPEPSQAFPRCLEFSQPED
ncbi:unnamed protein product [Boreogadus saida]